jgi:hypothetical protein
MEVLATCALCVDVEDVHHVVIQCPHAKSLRQAMRKKWILLREKDLQYNGHEWLLRVIDKDDPEVAG